MPSSRHAGLEALPLARGRRHGARATPPAPPRAPRWRRRGPRARQGDPVARSAAWPSPASAARLWTPRPRRRRALEGLALLEAPSGAGLATVAPWLVPLGYGPFLLERPGARAEGALHAMMLAARGAERAELAEALARVADPAWLEPLARELPAATLAPRVAWLLNRPRPRPRARSSRTRRASASSPGCRSSPPRARTRPPSRSPGR